MLVYIDGAYLSPEDAKISGNVFMLDEHLERLYDSAKSIMLEIPIAIDAMKHNVLETLRRNQLREGYIRLIVTRGIGDLGLDPEKCPNPSVVIKKNTMKTVWK